jgi:hypothetical protein
MEAPRRSMSISKRSPHEFSIDQCTSRAFRGYCFLRDSSAAHLFVDLTEVTHLAGQS